ncbi:MAG: zf-HC2 domain-containing protein [Micromonosporaceae bacterium]|nr:zf-HC2 domain-containing protein [Micromonosporaceae bacterium]
MIHPTDQLPDYAAATLPPDVTDRVREHVEGCAQCRAELAAWQQVAAGVRERVEAVAAPSPALFAAIRTRLTRPAVARYAAPLAHAPVRRAVGVLAYQWRLIRWPVWVLGGLVLAGTALATLTPVGADRVLATVIPLSAAAAIAGVCGRGVDPAAELIGSTLTSPRVVLLARLTSVLATATVAGLVLTGVAAGTASTGLAGALTLIMAWLVPLAALSAASFALSVLVRPSAGVVAAVAAWFVRAMSLDGANRWLSDLLDPLWTQAPVVFTLTVIVMALTIFLAPRRERFRAAG